MDQEQRRLHIITVAALIIGPVAAVVVSGLLWSRSPRLTFTVDNSQNKAGGRLVTIIIANLGNAPSQNVSGWVDFPSGEKPRTVLGHPDFEVKIRDKWKPMGFSTALKFRTERVYFRAARLQPDVKYTLKFASEGENIDFAKKATVHIVDDTGAARKSIVL